jgi:hypothetical protein
MGMRKQEVIHCSFCGQSQLDVKKIICGPNVYICNECIDRCNEIIQEDEPAKSEPKAEPLRPHKVETIDNARRAYYKLTALPSKAWIERFYANWKVSTRYMKLKPEVRFDGKTLIVITPGNGSPVYHLALERCIQKTNDQRKSNDGADS